MFSSSSKEIPSASGVLQVDCSVSIIVQIGQVFVDLQAGLRAGLASPIQHGAECMLKCFFHQALPRRLRPPRRRPCLCQPPLLHEVICFLEFGRGRR